jgi:hypothetical protein
MSDEGRGLEEVERALAGLRNRLAYPSAERLSVTVITRIQTVPRAARWWWRYRPVSLATSVGVAAILLVAAVTGLLLLFPGAREAVADFLGLRGIRIQYEASPAPPGGKLDLGQRVSIEEASDSASFEILRPSLTELGEPDEVYLREQEGLGAMVSFLWRPSNLLPEVDESGIGLLFTQFRAGIDQNVLGKGLGRGVRLESVLVDGEKGFWIEGELHSLYVFDDKGELQTDKTRLAANTLLWERDGLTLRLESRLSKAESLRIATSIG